MYMKRSSILSLCLLIVCTAAALAQFDARRLPFYLDINRQDALPAFKNPSAWKTTPNYSPELFKKINILQGGSITSPDGFRISLASVNSTNPNESAPVDQTETSVA